MAWIVDEQKRLELEKETRTDGKYVKLPDNGKLKVMIRVNNPPKKVERLQKATGKKFFAYEYETADGRVLSVFEYIHRDIVSALMEHRENVDKSEYAAIEIQNKGKEYFITVVAGV